MRLYFWIQSYKDSINTDHKCELNNKVFCMLCWGSFDHGIVWMASLWALECTSRTEISASASSSRTKTFFPFLSTWCYCEVLFLLFLPTAKRVLRHNLYHPVLRINHPLPLKSRPGQREWSKKEVIKNFSVTKWGSTN